MTTSDLFRGLSLRGLALAVAVILVSGTISAQGWFDESWTYRRAVSVPNPSGTDLTDFQVSIALGAGNFSFANALSDGSDIRITTSDGSTTIPFWIESWNPAGQSAIIWVKIPVLPAAGTSVFIYYGNPAPVVTPPEPVETPPTGPFSRNVLNPIVPAGDPGTGANLLAENVVFDPVSGHYWMVFAVYRSGSYGVGLAWSDSPTDAASWHWHGNIYTHATNGSFAPHILYDNGLWYVFFAIRPNIVYITCSTINGTYSAPTVVLSPSETWETYRVDEPYVFRRNDGTWILTYMGDAGSTTEQIGYATAASLTGPYTKFAGNPCLPFGPAGSYDAGTVADPWVYEYHGVYYIGYTVSPTKSSPWSTACATTTDWLTFTKMGVIFPVASSGWDSNNSFRGAVTRIDDEYLFTYTGDSYRMGIATQPVFVTGNDEINNPDAVFDFYDGFDAGSDPDPAKWTFTSGNPTSHTTIDNGLLTMTATGATVGTYVRLDGTRTFGVGYVGETRARHPNQGTTNMIMEVGFGSAGFVNIIRLVDDFPGITNWQRQTMAASVTEGVLDMAQPADQNWHVFKLYRNNDATAGFQVDNTTRETVTTNVPVVNLQQFMMSFGNTNQMIVDWTRVRKWAGSDPVTSVGLESGLATGWTGAVNSDWTNPGNWSAGVPGEWSQMTVSASARPPVFAGTLTVSPDASLTVESGGALTVNGGLTASGPVTISSTLASSGSLIVAGTSTGNITYNRQLKPGNDSGSDWHLAASPVATNANGNAGKINTVYQWSEPTGTWTSTGLTSTVAGRGYNIRQETASDGLISFTGPIVNTDLTVPVSSPYADAVGANENYFTRSYVAGRSLENMGGRGWNLLGNPYTSAILVDDFITANYNAAPGQSQFDLNHVALYMFDGTTRSYYYLARSTGWPSGTRLSETHIQAGQGFFVMAMDDDSEFQFTRAMQEHSTSTPMLKSGGGKTDRWPGLQLKVRHLSGEVFTTIVYNGSMTPGVDPGYDIGLYRSGQDVEIYSTLALKDNGLNYTRQALPVSGADTLVIPVGVDFKAGGEVTFSATVVPVEGRRFWLEDRQAGVITDLSLKSYTVMLPANTYGTGRFFILVSANTPTGISHSEIVEDDLRIWVSGGRLVIKGLVSAGSAGELFDLQGRELMESKLSDGEINIIDLPVGLHGILVVKVTDGQKLVISKIVIP